MVIRAGGAGGLCCLSLAAQKEGASQGNANLFGYLAGAHAFGYQRGHPRPVNLKRPFPTKLHPFCPGSGKARVHPLHN